jgi:hypothetical protein
VLGSPAGAQIKVDNRDVGAMPMSQAVRVPTGEVVVSVSAPGHISISRRIMISSTDEIARETIVLHAFEGAAAPSSTPPPPIATDHWGSASDVVAASPAAPAGPLGAAADLAHEPAAVPVNPRGRPWQVTAAAVGTGVGVLFLAGGIAAQASSSSKNNEFNNVTNAPNGTGECNEKLDAAGGGPCQGLLNAAHFRVRLAIAGYIASGVTLAGSLILFLIAPARSPDDGTVAGACVPLGETGGVACALTLRF